MKTLTLIILSIILLSLKILGIIKISIFLCLTPLWLPVALFLALALIILPLAAILCMAGFCLVILLTLPCVVIRELVRQHRKNVHHHAYHSKALGLDQCDGCGDIRETA